MMLSAPQYSLNKPLRLSHNYCICTEIRLHTSGLYLVIKSTFNHSAIIRQLLKAVGCTRRKVGWIIVQFLLCVLFMCQFVLALHIKLLQNVEKFTGCEYFCKPLYMRHTECVMRDEGHVFITWHEAPLLHWMSVPSWWQGRSQFKASLSARSNQMMRITNGIIYRDHVASLRPFPVRCCGLLGPHPG